MIIEDRRVSYDGRSSNFTYKEMALAFRTLQTVSKKPSIRT